MEAIAKNEFSDVKPGDITSDADKLGDSVTKADSDLSSLKSGISSPSIWTASAKANLTDAFDRLGQVKGEIESALGKAKSVATAVKDYQDYYENTLTPAYKAWETAVGNHDAWEKANPSTRGTEPDVAGPENAYKACVSILSDKKDAVTSALGS